MMPVFKAKVSGIPPMTTQPEIPKDIRENAADLSFILTGTASSTQVAVITKWLLDERNRTIAECAGIAEDDTKLPRWPETPPADQWELGYTTGRQESAGAIRALLK